MRWAGSSWGRWQPWFAWRPVQTISGEWVWLERIHRWVGRDFKEYKLPETRTWDDGRFFDGG